MTRKIAKRGEIVKGKLKRIEAGKWVRMEIEESIANEMFSARLCHL
ncbi:MAG: hypothetical protein JW893_03640 [Candidatus Omnitrophica bacterium]|nr:hypothetical protein [Candidatus Omnitrophota bacterium]